MKAYFVLGFLFFTSILSAKVKVGDTVTFATGSWVKIPYRVGVVTGEMPGGGVFVRESNGEEVEVFGSYFPVNSPRKARKKVMVDWRLTNEFGETSSIKGVFENLGEDERGNVVIKVGNEERVITRNFHSPVVKGLKDLKKGNYITVKDSDGTRAFQVNDVAENGNVLVERRGLKLGKEIPLVFSPNQYEVAHSSYGRFTTRDPLVISPSESNFEKTRALGFDPVGNAVVEKKGRLIAIAPEKWVSLAGDPGKMIDKKVLFSKGRSEKLANVVGVGPRRNLLVETSEGKNELVKKGSYQTEVKAYRGLAAGTQVSVEKPKLGVTGIKSVFNDGSIEVRGRNKQPVAVRPGDYQPHCPDIVGLAKK